VSRTYKVTGINLKGSPLGESDRLLTLLTAEQGLLRVVAAGARKQGSKLGGRSGLFVVNNLVIAKGKSLDRLIQAETIESYPGLSSHLGKLTAGQYLAEVLLAQTQAQQPQADLFHLLCEHLKRLERSSPDQTLAHLCQALFHILALIGLAPQVYHCCLSQTPLVPPLGDPDWQVTFNPLLGGLVWEGAPDASPSQTRSDPMSPGASLGALPMAPLQHLNALEVNLLQTLAQPQLPELPLQSFGERPPWPQIEKMLRQSLQHHLDRPIRSANLIDSLTLTPT
jgi:DNA repair protein RecO (recombination protein O)